MGISIIKVKCKILFCFFTIFLFLSMCSISQGQTNIDWTVQILDSDMRGGQCSSIGLDSYDNPYISYFGSAYEKGLKCAIWSGSAWEFQVVDPNVEFQGKWSSIAIDSNNKPHIAYTYYSNFTRNSNQTSLKYASWIGSTWNIQTIDSSDNLSAISLFLDSNDNPSLSYMAGSSLNYASWAGSTWNIQTIDSRCNVGGGSNSLFLDSIGNPHLAYSAQGSLKYASWIGSTWNIQTIDSGSFASCSLKLDSTDNPHISYHDMSNITNLSITSLKYASWIGSTWNIQIIDSKGHVGGFNSLALDDEDNPCISYYKSITKIANLTRIEDGDLMFAKWNGTNWTTETVISTGEVGQYSSLALDSEQNPHLACWAAGSNYLVYSKGILALPIITSSPTTTMPITSTPTFTPTPTLSTSPSLFPAPSPTIPEFQTWIILSVFLIITLALVLIVSKK
jgi:hypothetical protein